MLTFGLCDAVNVLWLKAVGGWMSIASAVMMANSLRDEKNEQPFGHQQRNTPALCSFDWSCTKLKPQPTKNTLQNLVKNSTASWITRIKVALLSSLLTSISVKRLFYFSIPFIVDSLSLSFQPAAFNFKRTTVTLLLIQPLLANKDVRVSFHSLFTLLKV